MKDTALYEQLIGLKTPWTVKKVDLSLEDQRVVVEVVLKDGEVWADPTDATKRAHINGWSERQWRHLDTCQFETVIKARIPQLKYSDGTVEELAGQSNQFPDGLYRHRWMHDENTGPGVRQRNR